MSNRRPARRVPPRQPERTPDGGHVLPFKESPIPEPADIEALFSRGVGLAALETAGPVAGEHDHLAVVIELDGRLIHVVVPGTDDEIAALPELATTVAQTLLRRRSERRAAAN